MKCKYCDQKLIKIDRREEMADLDGEVTDGQMADYLAAELSGDHGAWGIGIVGYYCSRCKMTFEVISDQLKDYSSLILNWHEKAKGGDYFSRFVFEYLALIAHLKNNLFIDAASDRRAIQFLKQDTIREQCYLQTVMANRQLLELWQSVIAELGRNPLHNTSKDWDYPEIDAWWNSTGKTPDHKDQSQKGVVRSLSDWGNMVEYWYGVRNNLFHGGKDPDIQRDCFIVEHAYETLAKFMDNEIAAGSCV